jgi:hypothetical protein
VPFSSSGPSYTALIEDRLPNSRRVKIRKTANLTILTLCTAKILTAQPVVSQQAKQQNPGSNKLLKTSSKVGQIVALIDSGLLPALQSAHRRVSQSEEIVRFYLYFLNLSLYISIYCTD